MLIVDSQVHIWGADTPERPWPAVRNQPHRPVPFSREDLVREMEGAQVHRAAYRSGRHRDCQPGGCAAEPHDTRGAGR